MKSAIGLLVLALCLTGCNRERPGGTRADNGIEADRYAIGSNDPSNTGNSLDDTLANIVDDTLVAPVQPQLQIEAQPEELLLQIIRPDVFLKNELFAHSFAASNDAAVVFTSLPVEGSIQVHFHNQAQWISGDSIKLVPAYSHSIAGMDSSADGNTLAVLIKAAEHNAWQPGVRILERLGEAWLVTGGVSLPMDVAVSDQTTVILAADGDRVLVGTTKHLMIYHRTELDWMLSRQFTAPSGSTFAAVSANKGVDQLLMLQQQDEQLRLHSVPIGEGSDNDIDADTDSDSDSGNFATTMQPSFNLQTWQDSHYALVQGIDATDEVILKSNGDGSSVIVAGWDSTVATERSPVLWRLSLTQDAQGNSASVVNVLDSLRATPTSDLRASLRFSANENLDTVALGWNNPPADDAMLITFTYSDREGLWRSALSLPDTIPTLAKQAFAGQIRLSADGHTLLIANPAGRSTAADNHVGELLIVH